MFARQIGKTMEVYVDDMLVMSLKMEEYIHHLREMLEIFRGYRMKLNPKKCSFAVSTGKFLGYIINHRDIEAKPAKIKALLDIRSPQVTKEVQSSNGRIAVLGRFVARATDKSHSFFQALKKGKNFAWDEKCKAAFLKLKE